jgi:hypothetical protein
MMGDFFWSKVRLEALFESALGCLPRFLTDRPAIHKIMKGMDLRFTME